MIRIAYVINYIVKNGPSSVVLNLIDNLNRLEYDIALITLFEGNNAKVVSALRKYSLQGTTQGRYLTGGVPPVRFSM